MDAESSETEVDRNYEVFKTILPELLLKAPGKYVVMHSGAVVEILDTFGDAARYGHKVFGIGRFSVQEITNQAISFGYHSHAVHQSPD